jgi:hypothetical protein
MNAVQVGEQPPKLAETGMSGPEMVTLPHSEVDGSRGSSQSLDFRVIAHNVSGVLRVAG